MGDEPELEVDDLDYSDACIDLRPHVWIDTGTNLMCEVCDAERG